MRKTYYTHTREDKGLIILVITILVFGLIMIYNSTAVFSFDTFGGAYKFLFLQLTWIILGMLGFWFFYNFDYRNFLKLSFPIYLVSVVFLLITAIAGIIPCDINIPFAPCINGANRWFYLNPQPLPSLPFLGVLGFQPSEFGKLTVIILLSVIFSKVSASNNSDWHWFYKYLIYCGSVGLLVMLQPNMSTAALILSVGAVIYISSGAMLKPMLISAPIVGTLGILAMILSPYRRERFMGFISSDPSNTEGAGYHVKQILIALGSGGFFGVGFGQSRQKYQYLPEVSADSIFAIIGEELGLIGTVTVVLVFLYLFYKGFKIAVKSRDLLGKLLSIGIVSWIGFQFFVNVAAMTKLIPLTGVPLPLISYGGSSTLFSLMSLGILANVAKNNN